jgi:hypothetical protein
MAAPFDDENEEKPLDPSVERVRRKLLRFMAINLSLLFAAVIIVVAAIVYRSATKEAPAVASSIETRAPSGEVLEGDIAIPAGSRVVSHTLSGNRVSLDVELAGGQHTIIVYDLAERRIVAKLAVKPE